MMAKEQAQQAVIDHEREATELFCLCRQPYDPARFMIGCDKCDGWFHAKCVNILVFLNLVTSCVLPE